MHAPSSPPPRYEGWRVGVDHPAYARFNEAIDCLVCLDADADAIREWKVESSRRDKLAAGLPFDEAQCRAAFDAEILPFVNLYERPLLARAQLILKKSATQDGQSARLGGATASHLRLMRLHLKA